MLVKTALPALTGLKPPAPCVNRNIKKMMKSWCEYQKSSNWVRLTAGVTAPYMKSMQTRITTPEIQGHSPKRASELSRANPQFTRWKKTWPYVQ